jgi:hypothetical protein
METAIAGFTKGLLFIYRDNAWDIES